MSLKENIAMVKEELNSEEKFFEKAVITERFVKKYKNLLIASVIIIVVVVVANIAYDINKNNKIEAANKALAILSKDPTNSNSAVELKALSPNLYDAWRFSLAVSSKDLKTLKELKNSKALIVGDISTYELAQFTEDISALEDYSLKQNSIYKDLALVQEAIILMNENKIDEAHTKLLNIPKTSSLSKLTEALLHYGVK